MDSLLNNNIALFVISLVFGVMCSSIAAYKNRSKFLWFLGGIILGFIGLIIILCIKQIPEEKYKTQKTELDLLEELSRYKKLYEDGTIDEYKYNVEKDRIEDEIEKLK